jgi:hypothetical protein
MNGGFYKSCKFWNQQLACFLEFAAERIPLPPPLQVAENGNRLSTAAAGLCFHARRNLMWMPGKGGAQWREYLSY